MTCTKIHTNIACVVCARACAYVWACKHMWNVYGLVKNVK